MHGRTPTGFFFVLPLLTGLLFFHLIPVGAAILLSMTKWTLTAPPHWLGLSNFTTLLGGWAAEPDPLFLKALFNTAVICLVVPFQVAGSFALALFLNRGTGWSRLCRLVVFLPTLVTPMALYIMWRAIFNVDVGLLARALSIFGIQGPLWLEDPAWSKPAVMLVLFWESVGGFQMLFFLAGLRQIPQQLHDMAILDGLNIWYRVKDIYWPWLKSLVIFNGCLGLIGAVQGGFEIAYIMTGGGPLRSTTTLSYYLFENAFEWQRPGYGAAVGIVMFVILLPLAAVKIGRGRHA